MKKLLFCACLGFIILLGCQPASVYTSGATRYRKNVYMVASWYGEPFHGRITANGEVYDMYKYTAAHRTLPFGTKLRLINEENGKEIEVVINDRGPVPRDRDIDVSYQTAVALDFVNKGITRLRVVML